MLLLDTHALLWVFSDSGRLSDDARDAIGKNDLCVSVASLWEIGIKSSLKKEEKRLELQKSIQEIAAMCDAQGIEILPITPEACEKIRAFPHIHEDPFDRMIVAQAILRNLTLVTKDENIHKYDEVDWLW